MKKFATNARRELLERVELQARKIGITREKIEEANVESSDALYINGKQLSDIERRQRNKLIKRIEEIGFDQVMEETAYTWFNRFIALRFMEVNNYLPTRVRVLSSESEGSTEPDMIKEALSLDLPINKEYVYEFKIENKTDELFKYLIKLHCNDLNRYMPFMFESIEDYKEILFPEGLLGKDSFLQELTNTEIIPEVDWENVEIIGWLYQYYISEEKDKVFADFKKNIKINKNTLPAATQLFTSNWIVRLMVENSLGKMWLDTNPDSSIREQMEYYLDEAEQEETTREILQKLRQKNLKLEEVTFLDPACGSGHILVYAFDLFYDLYLDQGYMKSEIPKLILENNIFGLDIDDRAVQLASFSVMMKAREKNRRIFNENIKLNIHAIQDTEWLTDNMIDSFAGQNEDIRQTLNRVKETFQHGKLIGSLALVEGIDTNLLKERYDTYLTESTDLFDVEEREQLLTNFPKIIDQVEILQNKYSIVCTNPPYRYATENLNVILGYLNSKVVRHILNLLNPTINYSPGLIAKIPFIKLDEGTKARVEKLVDDSVAITKKDWDSFEISWDFTKHPLLEFPNATIQESFNEWEQFKENQFEQLRANEEELNQIFNEQYGVENELTSDIPDEDITLRKADVARDMKSF